MFAFIVHPDPSDPRVALLVKLLAQHGYESIITQTLDQARQHSQYAAGRSTLLVPDVSGEPSLADAVIEFAETEESKANKLVPQRASVAIVGGHSGFERTEVGQWFIPD